MVESMKQKTSLDDVEKDIRLAWDIVESINARRLLERQEEEIPDDLPLYSEVELKEVRDRVSKNLPRIIQTLQAPDPTPALKIIEMLTMTEDFVDTAVILLTSCGCALGSP